MISFVDDDWGGCPIDRKTNAGYVVCLARGAISWESRKQATVALSSTEAEYMSLSQIAKEFKYLRGLLCELEFDEIV